MRGRIRIGLRVRTFEKPEGKLMRAEFTRKTARQFQRVCFENGISPKLAHPVDCVRAALTHRFTTREVLPARKPRRPRQTKGRRLRYTVAAKRKGGQVK